MGRKYARYVCDLVVCFFISYHLVLLKFLLHNVMEIWHIDSIREHSPDLLGSGPAHKRCQGLPRSQGLRCMYSHFGSEQRSRQESSCRGRREIWKHQATTRKSWWMLRHSLSGLRPAILSRSNIPLWVLSHHFENSDKI